MTLSHSLWRRDSPNFPGIPEYMAILPQVRRIVSAAVAHGDPVRYLPLAVTYEDLPEWFPEFQAKAQQRKDQRDAAIAKKKQEADQSARADCSEPETLPPMRTQSGGSEQPLSLKCYTSIAYEP